MFYSHTFLARKGPLGTVWCAAHLQNRPRKSHYTSTNIVSTVELIASPAVPIALRLSGHLLLGVVRIYSKQVHYLYEDCNVVLISVNNVFPATSVNLPDDAKNAPFHSVTLPQKFQLDEMDLDDYCHDLGEDYHLKRKEDITLSEQIPTGKDPYIVITLDQHDLMYSPFMEDNSGSRVAPMDEDVPTGNVDIAVGPQDPSTSNQLRNEERTVGGSSPRDLPSIEIMRDARHDFHFNHSPLLLPDREEPDKFLEEQINKDSGNHTPVNEETTLPDGFENPSSQKHQDHYSFEHLNSPMPFVHETPDMVLQATPPVAQPKVRRRKRKHYFDESIILLSEDMKKALDDTSDLLRVKRNCPLSSLEIWKMNNKQKKDDAFSGPFVTGCCAHLREIYKEDFISSKPYLLTPAKEHEDASFGQPSLAGHDNDMDIEVLRNNECRSPDRAMPSFSTVMPSPQGRSYYTPDSSNVRLQSELEKTGCTEIPHTADTGESTRNLDSARTQDTFCGEGFDFGHTALSDIPEDVPSAGDLEFLGQDDNSPAGSPITPEYGFRSMNQGTPELRALSSRTRAVAQYLKKQSSETPSKSNIEESLGDLSLNKILEGKPRKICARMFYETLVLKNHGLVDIQQENPYDDVTLTVTSRLVTENF